jgi:hypothetical protein
VSSPFSVCWVTYYIRNHKLWFKKTFSFTTQLDAGCVTQTGSQPYLSTSVWTELEEAVLQALWHHGHYAIRTEVTLLISEDLKVLWRTDFLVLILHFPISVGHINCKILILMGIYLINLRVTPEAFYN